MKIIFLTYTNRSGSTFLANQLSKSDEICVCPEAHILVELFLIQPNKQVLKNIIPILASQFYRNEDYSNWELNEDYNHNTNYNVSNFGYFIRILEAYKNKTKPKANTILFKAERLIELYSSFNQLQTKGHQIFWIALIRDCRAVYNSQHNTFMPEKNTHMSDNPVRTAVFWNTFVEQCKMLSVNENFLQIKYEKLIINTKGILSETIQAIRLKNFLRNTNSGDLYSRLPENHKSIHQNIDSLPLENRIDAWESEMTRVDISLIEIVAKKNLIEFGYSATTEKFLTRYVFRVHIYVFFDIFRRLLKKLNYKLRILIKGF